MITAVVVYKKTYYIGSYAQDREKAAEARLLLSTIPEDASVKSTTFFIPQLSGRDEIYLADSRHPADYIVLDQRPGYEKDSQDLMADYLLQGYVVQGRWTGMWPCLDLPCPPTESILTVTTIRDMICSSFQGNSFAPYQFIFVSHA